MIKFLKRHWISIGLLVISSIIGLVVLIKESQVDIYRIEYEFKTDVKSQLPNYAQVDTVFQFRNIVCRNLSSSKSDTLIDEGVRRHEMKVFVPQPSNEVSVKIGEDLLLSSEHIKIINHRFQETQRKKRGLLYWILFGFFLGIVVEFVIALKKKPSSD